MSAHGFRFGVSNGSTGGLATWTAAARRAEAQGYATFLLPDTTGTPAPFTALAAAAAATSTLHVGTWVVCDPLRGTERLVWEAGALHGLVGPRFELGLGAGRPGAERDAEKLGVPFGSAGERVAHLEQTLGRVRESLPDAPLLVAGAGPRMLALAARYADTVALGWAPTTTVDDARGPVGQVRAAGRDVELASALIAVGSGATPWLERAGIRVAHLLAAGAVTVIDGDPQQMADTLQRRRDELGISYVTVPANVADDFAPVVEILVGQ